ncbi:hypothetical protein ACH5RR_036004 [Cinchona calisaya]|uniref:RNase H type-1 domain-containing protein n=1 Tax=Cinchona calisaya TaxID=153742 RepID=A0ABD2Y5W1_9GENT
MIDNTRRPPSVTAKLAQEYASDNWTSLPADLRSSELFSKWQNARTFNKVIVESYSQVAIDILNGKTDFQVKLLPCSYSRERSDIPTHPQIRELIS